VESIITPVGSGIQAVDDLLARTHGHSFYDNIGVSYSGPLPPTMLAGVNALVTRYEDTPDAANYVEQNYSPTGKILFPVVTLNTDRDPLVPAVNEAVYADTVGQAGNSNLLVQRTVNRYGHCAFTVDEMLGAFLDLAEWVESKAKPSP
jgi:hypothetical protein